MPAALLIESLVPTKLATELSESLRKAPFVDGSETARGSARLVKSTTQLPRTHPASEAASNVLMRALSQHPLFKRAAIPHTILPIRFSRYGVGMSYGKHLDLPVFSTPRGPLRTDLSLTIWLSPKDSYDGGELVIQTVEGERSFKGDRGDAVLYSSDTLHEVTPVTRGERLVGISWMQSLIRSPQHREILFELAKITDGVTEPAGQELRQVQQKLIRLWADC